MQYFHLSIAIAECVRPKWNLLDRTTNIWHSNRAARSSSDNFPASRKKKRERRKLKIIEKRMLLNEYRNEIKGNMKTVQSTEFEKIVIFQSENENWFWKVGDERRRRTIKRMKLEYCSFTFRLHLPTCRPSNDRWKSIQILHHWEEPTQTFHPNHHLRNWTTKQK